MLVPQQKLTLCAARPDKCPTASDSADPGASFLASRRSAHFLIGNPTEGARPIRAGSDTFARVKKQSTRDS